MCNVYPFFKVVFGALLTLLIIAGSSVAYAQGLNVQITDERRLLPNPSAISAATEANDAKISVYGIAPVSESATEQVLSVEPVIRDGKLYIDADVEFELSPELENAAYKGVPLHFTADVEITQARWWWFDKDVIKESQTWRVMYNALTRQWRVGRGDLLIPENSLDDALTPLRHIRSWAVAYAHDLDKEQELTGRIRLRLDTSLLARPFQVDAINSRSWTLATPWKDFTFSISDAAPQP